MPGVSAYSSPAAVANGQPLQGYISRMMRRYGAFLSKLRAPQLLDVGPICGENVNHFIQIAGRVHVCDLFVRLHAARCNHTSFSIILKDLDYPEETFLGVHLWDLCDRLTTVDAQRLLDRVKKLLKPGGWVIVTAYDDRSFPGCVMSFPMISDTLIRPRVQSHLDLPFTCRANRDMQILFKGYSQVDSYIYTSGLREMIFRKA